MRITKWSSSIMIVMLMISSPSVSAVAAEAPAAVETASAEQAQTAEAEARLRRNPLLLKPKRSPAKIISLLLFMVEITGTLARLR